MIAVLLAIAGAAGIGQMLDPALTIAQRNDACVALRGDRSPETIRAMRRGLLDPLVRACAARNLREAGAGAELRSALNESDPDVRAAAARELGLLRDGQAVPLLVRAAADPNLLVSAAAIEALARTGGQEAQDALIGIAGRGGVAGLTALQAAAGVDDARVLPAARRYLVEADAPAQVIAIGVIARLGDATDLGRLRALASTGEPVSARGRGFGLMPPIDVGQVARQALTELEQRLR